jgi:hypothetical protein
MGFEINEIGYTDAKDDKANRNILTNNSGFFIKLDLKMIY